MAGKDKDLRKEQHEAEENCDEQVPQEGIDGDDEAEADQPECEELLSELEDKYRRVLAEYDNYRKRSLKERENMYNDALAQAITSFLPILDNLERASEQSSDEGTKMIYKQFVELLERYNVTPFGEPGEAFDPNIHNAIFHIEDDSLGDGVLAEVMQKGFSMGERTLRPAIVKAAN